MIYLDYAATSPMRPEVLEAIDAAHSKMLGNPTGSHRLAREAKALLEDARETIAEATGVGPGEVIFTSGGTESCNLAVHSIATRYLQVLAKGEASPKAEIILMCSAVEHAAVLKSCQAIVQFCNHASLGSEPKCSFVEIPVDSHGLVDLPQLDELLQTLPSESLVFAGVMTANNETGAIQPIGKVSEIFHSYFETGVFFSDAVQAAPWIDLSQILTTDKVDMLAISGHKLGGPVGVGALIVREHIGNLIPLFHGGGQERDRRSGTQDVVGSIALAEALRIAIDRREDDTQRISNLRDQLQSGTVSTIAGTTPTLSPSTPVLSGHCHIRFDNVEQEELLVMLDDAGVYASAGSSCASGALEHSHVLGAMGLTDKQARSSIRFSLGWNTTQDDIDVTIEILQKAVESLRRDQ